MTTKKTGDPDENPLGVLDDTGSIDTAGIGILGGTAQVRVTLPIEEDDDLVDDGVVDGEVVGDLIIDDVAVEGAPVPIAAAAITISSTPVTPPVEEATTASPVSSDTPPPAPAPEKPIVKAAINEGAQRPAGSETDAVREAIVLDDSSAGDEPGSDDVSSPHAEEEAAAARFLAKAGADAGAAASPSSVSPGPSPRKEPRMSTSDSRSVTPSPVQPAPAAEVTLASKRLGELSESARESADLLTADRLLDPHHVTKPEPEGGWSHFLYTVSGRRINIGDSRRARERKALTARIGAPLTGGARFIPVLSRKGGVGKTTITALLGMALADAREDRVIAVDANPDRGTLADRVVRPQHGKSVRDLVRIRDEVRGYHDISAIVARDATRLDVLASDADPHVAEAFSDTDYRDVAAVAAHYYSLVLTDTGTGIVHSVMSATLDLADQLVIVSGLSVDEARLASETLTWLETNGYTEQARNAIVVLNQSTPGSPLVRLNELQAHFATRVRSVVRVPYDPQIAGGGSIVFANLQPETRTAARELAALLVEGLRAKAA